MKLDRERFLLAKKAASPSKENTPVRAQCKASYPEIEKGMVIG
jgi:hypothetical protein